MARILADCSGQLAPTNEQAPVVAAPAPGPGCGTCPVCRLPRCAPAPARCGCAGPAPAAPAPASARTGSCSAGRRLLRQLRRSEGRRGRTDLCRSGRLPRGTGPRRRRRGLRKLDLFHHSFQTFQGGKMKKTLALVVLTGLMLTGCGGKKDGAAGRSCDRSGRGCCKPSRFRACWAWPWTKPRINSKISGSRSRPRTPWTASRSLSKKNWQVTSQDPTGGASRPPRVPPLTSASRASTRSRRKRLRQRRQLQTRRQPRQPRPRRPLRIRLRRTRLQQIRPPRRRLSRLQRQCPLPWRPLRLCRHRLRSCPHRQPFPSRTALRRAKRERRRFTRYSRLRDSTGPGRRRDRLRK